MKNWLLGQQYKTVHPYTNADPGGWSWTDLPGGVPDADDTPGAMLALLRLSDKDDRKSQAALAAAVRWLLGLQNRDGGFPTFCRGWGTLPFDRSSNDITAHCLRALLAWIKSREPEAGPLEQKAAKAIGKGFQFLTRHQRADGSWLPLWFGNQRVADDENPTYGTAKVLAAYRDCDRMEDSAAQRGLDWLEANQNADGGWGGGSETPSSVEETALATEALISCGRCGSNTGLAVNWLLAAVESDRFKKPDPIGFYFAKLWYYEDLYPLIFTVSALQTACRSDYNVHDSLPESQPQRETAASS